MNGTAKNRGAAECGRGHAMRRRGAAVVLTGALTAAGAGAGTGVAQAADQSVPEGSSLSAPLNQLAMGSMPFTDWLETLVRGIQGVVPGPFTGSTGEHGSSGMLNWNVVDYK